MSECLTHRQHHGPGDHRLRHVPHRARLPVRAREHPDVSIHQFGTGNAKIEQRFLLGTGAQRFTVRRTRMNETAAHRAPELLGAKYGPYGAFTYNAPNDDGNGTTAYTCRFANEPLSWAVGRGLDVLCRRHPGRDPRRTPTYTLNSHRYPLPFRRRSRTALLSQVQQVIPLMKIQPLQAGYPAIYLSDRRCTVGGQLYQARLIDFDGISQGMGNESDDASFTFGNADRVMRDLANDMDLYRAAIEFSLFHVGHGHQARPVEGRYRQLVLRRWPGVQGHRRRWPVRIEPAVPDTEDLPHLLEGVQRAGVPVRRAMARSIWSTSLTRRDSKCDKKYDTANGCLAHGMKYYYGGILAEPQGVRIKDNSTGVWGFGRSPLTSVSLVADSIYDQVLPEVYTDTEMPVNCKVAAGRDESDFYEALGIVGEGPLVAYTPTALRGQGRRRQRGDVGRPHARRPGAPRLSRQRFGLRLVLGNDPAGATDFFSLDQSGDHTGGDFRKVYSGESTYKDNFAAGMAFLVIRRSDAKGLQLSKPGDHAMIATCQQGLRGGCGRSRRARDGPSLTNPVWIAVNMLLRARGLRLGATPRRAQLNAAEAFFDVQAAIDAAAICNDSVTKLVGVGTRRSSRSAARSRRRSPSGTGSRKS